MIIYPYWDYSLTKLVKWAKGENFRLFQTTSNESVVFKCGKWWQIEYSCNIIEIYLTSFYLTPCPCCTFSVTIWQTHNTFVVHVIYLIKIFLYIEKMHSVMIQQCAVWEFPSSQFAACRYGDIKFQTRMRCRHIAHWYTELKGHWTHMNRN